MIKYFFLRTEWHKFYKENGESSVKCLELFLNNWYFLSLLEFRTCSFVQLSIEIFMDFYMYFQSICLVENLTTEIFMHFIQHAPHYFLKMVKFRLKWVATILWLMFIERKSNLHSILVQNTAKNPLNLSFHQIKQKTEDSLIWIPKIKLVNRTKAKAEKICQDLFFNLHNSIIRPLCSSL